MEIVISSTGQNLDSPFEPRFGRCSYFVFVDSNTREWQAEPNPAVSSSGGAGTEAAQFVLNKGAQAVISGRFGPNAYAVFQAAGVEMYAGSQRRVSDVLEAFLNQELSTVTAASAPGHQHRRRAGF